MDKKQKEKVIKQKVKEKVKKDKEKVKKQKDKEKLKKDKEKVIKQKQKDKEKLKKQKDKEKLKKQKEKEKLKKQKDKEKVKKQKEKEKLKKQKDKEKRKIRKKIYKGGEVTTRQKKDKILQILSSWEREDDPDDYFEMWKEHFDKRELFIILNYNFLTELQIIKDLIHEKKLTPSDCSFRYIMNRIKPYSFLTLLAETINEEEIDDNKKKLLFIEILKNLIKTYILLTNNIFNETIFPQIGEPTALYRTWRNNHQLESMKSLSKARSLSASPRRKRQKVEEDILITDNYLSTSRSKELALRFYKNSYGGRKEFILWKIEIPAEYPNLHVSEQLKEVLLHVGSRLKFKKSITYEQVIDGSVFEITEETYEYMGYNEHEIDEILNKYKEVVKILSKVSGI